jgi:hypothetical protein
MQVARTSQIRASAKSQASKANRQGSLLSRVFSHLHVLHISFLIQAFKLISALVQRASPESIRQFRDEQKIL